MRRVRAIARLAWLTAEIVMAMARWIVTPARSAPDVRARWMQRTARRFLRVLGCRVRVEGQPPRGGLVVANHLGYLDVLVIGAACPAVFVAKAEVRNWPVLGTLTRMAGTVFVDRQRRTAVGPTLVAMRDRLAAGCPVVVFPEGTSSDGGNVLPFRSALLAAAEETPATPCALAYALPGGSVPEEVCYWADMVFAPHLWNLLGRQGLEATVRFGPAQEPMPRKVAADCLRASVSRLRDQIAARKALGTAKCAP